MQKNTSPKLHLRWGGKVSSRVSRPRRKMQQPHSRRPWLRSKPVVQKGRSSAHQPLLMSAPFPASAGMPICSASKSHQGGLSSLPAFFMGPFWYLCSSVTSSGPLPAVCVLITLLLSKLWPFLNCCWFLSSEEMTAKTDFLPWALNRPQLFYRTAFASSKDRTRELKIHKKTLRWKKWKAVVTNLLTKTWRPTKLLIIIQVSPVMFPITF